MTWNLSQQTVGLNNPLYFWDGSGSASAVANPWTIGQVTPTLASTTYFWDGKALITDARFAVAMAARLFTVVMKALK